MRRQHSIILAVALTTLTLGLSPPVQTTAAEVDQLTVGFSYVPPVTTMAEGDTLFMNNVDPVPHNITAGTPLDPNPALFASATATGRHEVVGTSELAPGTYAFFCTLHPWMNGQLAVTGDSGLPPLPEPPEPPSGPSGLEVVHAGSVDPTATSITVFDDGSGPDLYVATLVQGAVYRHPVLPSGLIAPGSLYAAGFSSPLGIAFDDSGWMYVSDSHPSARQDRSTAGRVWAVPPGGDNAGNLKELVIDELPNGRHNTNGLTVHDGRLYITNGNSTDDGVDGGEPEEALSGTLLSVPTGTRDAVVLADTFGAVADGEPIDLVVEAVGMRNNFDVEFRPGTDEAWMTVNGPDTQDPKGQDTFVKAPIGGELEDFGFPSCVYEAGPGGLTDPLARNSDRVADPGDLPPCAEHDPPEVLLGLHVSADGFAFAPRPEVWGNAAYITYFGNFFPSGPTVVVGHRIVRVPLDVDGNVTGPPEDVLPGILPLDLAFGPDGLYVADLSGVLHFVPDSLGAQL